MRLILNKDYIGKLINDRKPICKICNKYVDRLEKCKNFQTNKLVIIAHCHDDIDRMEIGLEEVNDVDWKSLSAGYAFNSKVLPKKIKEMSN